MKHPKAFKSIPWILILGLILSAYAQNGNLIKNPSVEYGSPDYWFAGGSGGSWSSVGHTGIHSLNLNTATQEGNWRAVIFNVTANGNSTFVFWVYGNCSSTFFLYIRFWSDYGGASFISQTAFPILSGSYLDWKMINETSLKAPSNALSADLYISSNGGTGNLFFDDFSYVETVKEESTVTQWFHELFYGSAKWLTLIVTLAIVITIATTFPYGAIFFLPLTIFLGIDYFRNVSASSDFMWGAITMMFVSIYILMMAIRKAKS